MNSALRGAPAEPARNKGEPEGTETSGSPPPCPKCHSARTRKFGASVSSAGRRQRWRCPDCRAIFLDPHNATCKPRPRVLHPPCPYCHSDKRVISKGRRRFLCRACRQMFTRRGSRQRVKRKACPQCGGEGAPQGFHHRIKGVRMFRCLRCRLRFPSRPLARKKTAYHPGEPGAIGEAKSLAAGYIAGRLSLETIEDLLAVSERQVRTMRKLGLGDAEISRAVAYRRAVRMALGELLRKHGNAKAAA